MPSPDLAIPTTPALLAGGAENAVATARALLHHGIEVVTLADDRAPVHRVRGVRPARLGPVLDDVALARWFAGSQSRRWEGAAVLPLSDPVLAHLAANHGALSERFHLTRMVPEVVQAMLDKQRTGELARAAGIATPGQFAALDPGESIGFAGQVRFPAVVKPRNTFELVRRIGHKFLWALDEEELQRSLRALVDLPGGVTVLEFVPGPDSLLSSYNAVWHDGQPLVEFTKRIERRFPRNEGGATLHRMDRVDAVVELGRRFFRYIGLEGVGNVEFKYDERDGEYKLIECNHRMTAATPLIQRSGIDLAWAAYRQAIGRPTSLDGRARPRWYWYPALDLRAARQVSRRAVVDWLATPLRRPVLPYFDGRDPGPSLQHASNEIRAVAARRRARR